MRTIWLLFCILTSIPIFAQGLYNKNAFIVQKGGSIGTQQHFTNNGKFVQQSGTFFFGGAGIVQKLKGSTPISFNRLYIASGSNALLESKGHTIKNVVNSDGLLQANNHLTLLSDVNTTAAVDGSGVGEITGTLTFQSYIANGYGYKYLGSPFQSATVNQMADFVNLSAAFPSVYQYDEDLLSNGWVNYMVSTNLLEPMRGYAFQFGNNNQPKTLFMNGVVNNGNITLNINNNNRTYTKGFHLVSNPYPSPINWDETLGWTKTNIDNALYFFDTDELSIYTGIYHTYINGISSNGLANNFIPAMQAFFVRVSDGDYPVAGNLTVNNKARMNQLTMMHRKVNSIPGQEYLRLSLRYSGKLLADPLVIYFSPDAVDHFSKQMDAVKLMNASDYVPSVYTFKQGHKLAIHASPPIAFSSTIPVGVQVKLSGEYEFNNVNPSSLPLGMYVYLYDSLTKKYIDLVRDPAYKVQLLQGEQEHRFSIVFTKTPIRQQLNSDNPIGAGEFIVEVVNRQVYFTLSSAANSPKNMQLTNMLGQKLLLRTYTIGGRHLVDYPFSFGTYIITVWDGKTYASKKIIITE